MILNFLWVIFYLFRLRIARQFFRRRIKNIIILFPFEREGIGIPNPPMCIDFKFTNPRSGYGLFSGLVGAFGSECGKGFSASV